MSGMTLPKLIGGVLAAALLVAPAAQADLLDSVDGIHVAAQDGVRLWNHVGADNLFVLVDDAGDTLAGTPAQYTPFDVSLGDDREGRVVAVYSRCVNGDECSLYAYDVDAQTERPLGLAGTSPSLSEGVLAFARPQRLSGPARRQAARDR